MRYLRQRRRGRDTRQPSGRHEPPANRRVELTVNGEQSTVAVAPDASLLDVLRGTLGLLGTKEACGRGECGSCTVLVGGRARMACLELAVRTQEPVTTIEGVTEKQPGIGAAFADAGGYQCGFCTPGQIVRAAELLEEGLPAGDAALRRAMSGNICRCTGYTQIIEALRRAARTEGGLRD